ncbi:MAG: GAF domain-containing protein [Deltaproteobacteria bacterium]|nr:MAG: GAF domain-containing protein [Deltaproteobacteria bacterium]
MTSDRTYLFSLFPRIIEISNSNIAIENRLAYVCNLVKKAFNADCVCIYQLFPQSLYLIPWISTDPDVEKFRGEEFRVKLGEGIAGLAAWKRKPVFVRDVKEFSRGVSIVPFEVRDFTTVYSVPIRDDVYVYGAMNVASREARDITPEEEEFLRVVAIEIAGTIRNARLYEDSRKRVSELLTINEISRTVTSTFRLGEILSYALRTTVRITDSDGGVVRIYDPRSRKWEQVVTEGFTRSPLTEEPKRVGRKIASFVLREVKPLLINAPADSPFYAELSARGVSSTIAVPIVSKGKVVGVMTFYRAKGKDDFTHETLNLVHTVSILLANVVENVRMYREATELARENEVKVARLQTLYNVARSLMSTIKTERLLSLMLDALISPEGFRYSRAILFLVTEDGKGLRPALAYGGLSRKEARELERLLKKKRKTDADLERIASLRRRFFDLVRDHVISLESEPECIIASAVRDERAINCTRGCDRVLKRPDSFCVHHGENFLVVPVVVKGKVKGAIYVDNEFSDRPLTDEDIHVLTMFASEAGLALENSELYENLQRALDDLKSAQDRVLQSEKLAALGEMAAQLAHEIKNPLTVVGGFASRLMRVLSEGNEWGEERKKLLNYAWVIMKEVRRLERIVNQTLYFSRERKLELKETDLNSLVEEVLEMFTEELEEKGIELTLDLDADPPRVLADPDQVKQVLWNLVSNAEQAMTGGGKLTIRTERVKEPFSGVEIVISDTGGGIPPEVVGNIFNPFFTTRPSGTGLGLPIVHTIVTRHGGYINLDNRVGEGVTFHVILPDDPALASEERERERIFRSGIDGFKNGEDSGEGQAR